MSFLKAENIKLRNKIGDLENRVLNLVGSIKIFSGGMAGQEHEMNNHIAEIISTATELKIVAPYISEEYVMVLKDLAKGIKIQIVLNDRRLWPAKISKLYDQLKATNGIDLVNNPNVKYLLIWTPTVALFTSGALDKESLTNTVLIGTVVKEKAKLNDLLNIFKEMLPSFMR
jgi:hypothetical protein